MLVCSRVRASSIVGNSSLYCVLLGIGDRSLESVIGSQGSSFMRDQPLGFER